jgi:hypothetical protein
MRLSIVASLALLAGTLAGCQGPDVGQDCAFGNVIDHSTVAADYAASGITSCDYLVCIKSPSRPSAYCSKPCASNVDCAQSETGLECRALTFDQNFFAAHPELSAQYQPFLGPFGLSKYCAAPNL